MLSSVRTPRPAGRYNTIILYCHDTLRDKYLPRNRNNNIRASIAYFFNFYIRFFSLLVFVVSIAGVRRRRRRRARTRPKENGPKTPCNIIGTIDEIYRSAVTVRGLYNYRIAHAVRSERVKQYCFWTFRKIAFRRFCGAQRGNGDQKTTCRSLKINGKQTCRVQENRCVSVRRFRRNLKLGLINPVPFKEYKFNRIALVVQCALGQCAQS